MALCLSCSYLLLRANLFSGIASAAFSFSMALAPWVIVFARNLYWVPFTWFAPSLVTALSATLFSRVNTSRGQAISNLFLVGLQTIWDTAAKRGSSTTPGYIVERVCKNFTDPEKLKNCQDQYISSLTSSPFKVVFRYLFVPSFLPWIGHNTGRYSSQFTFPIFVALIFFAYRRDVLAALTIGSYFIGSTSWFVAAKGHSYIHYSINYVLWYLLFIPVAVLLVGKRLSRRHDAES